ncbi:MAG TPA: ribonuclease Z, partial [Bacteroidales bacterium]|nr:ribonuclease Z [Bacteroidales bacterium]
MTFSVQVLGSNSAIPTLTRNPSAHLLKADERLFLIDCAEGTQVQLRRFHIHFQRIRHIFISHLHGDHFYGLIGLLTSFHLLGRKEKLHLYAHEPLREIIDIQLKASRTTLIYPVVFHPLPDFGQQVNMEKLYEDDKLIVMAFPLVHSVPTCGFLFKEKPGPRKIRKEAVAKLNIPVDRMNRLKAGEDYTDDQGKVFRNAELTSDPPSPRSFAYCTDTAFTESILPCIRGASLLYHEATFLKDMATAAREKMHSTAAEAATIAK